MRGDQPSPQIIIANSRLRVLGLRGPPTGNDRKLEIEGLGLGFKGFGALILGLGPQRSGFGVKSLQRFTT